MLHDRPEATSGLREIIRDVRAQWRRRLIVRGLLFTVVGGSLVLVAAGFALEALRFSPAAILGFRVGTVLALAGLAGWWIGRPFLRSASDEQVALYIEEHDPELDALLLGAMSAEQDPHRADYSPALVQRLVEDAVARCQAALDGGRAIDVPRVRRYAASALAATALAVAIFAFGPAYLRQALSAMFSWSSVEAASPYRIELTPGDATVPRGSDQTIKATLSGFDAEDATLLYRKADQEAFERMPLVRADDGGFEAMIFDVSGRVEYLAEATGVRSRTYTFEVVDLPYVQSLTLEYHFPAYTGLEPRTVEDGGDIAVLAGTEVRVTVTPTMPTPGGQLVVDEQKIPLAVADGGTLTARFVAARDGFYHVDLQAPGGPVLTASPQYVIDILSDMAPTVSISKPGRDTPATPVEEFLIEAKADDDFGVRGLELVYSVNGGPEKKVSLYGGARRQTEVTAGHTLYLEELGVTPGDAVSYYARASDNDASGGKQTLSDIYFLRIRPFDKEFKPAMSQAGGGGGGGGEVGALSEQQRQIVAGTFNVQRDRKGLSADKLREATVVLALSQGRLREQVEGLAARMGSRLVTPDPSFKKIAELLPLAAAEMKAAEAKLTARDAAGALTPEQKALQYLQQAEEEYETQVTTSQNAGGGGGGAGSIAEDLADLFELEKDKLANQYETASRASETQAEQKIDELAEKLKELARRQQQELERQRRQAAARGAQGGGSPGGSQSQRALAEQAEQAARQLEQLSREQNRPDLAAAARQMQEAANAMRRAAAGDTSAAGQAASAADRLQQVQRQLQQAQASRAGRAVNEALRQAEEIAREHADVADDTTQMAGAGSDRLQQAQLLAQRREQLSAKVGELEQQIDRTANDLARDERDASRRLSEASGAIRDDKIKEKLRYSRGLMGRGGDPQAARSMDEDIGGNLTELRMKLADAAAALGKGEKAADAGDALDKARELVRGVDSLGERMREQATRDQSGQPGQRGQDDREGQGRTGREGEPGREGDPGEAGRQQARAGQQGQRGQQGQSGQEGQAGQEGQEGQAGQQGQAGQGGQQGQEGQQGQGGGAMGGDSMGRFGDEGGWGNARPGNFGADDIRQFRGEARRFGQDIESLRRALRAEQMDTRELDEILKRLRALEDERVYRDVQELARLQSQVSEGLRRFEFGLRRTIEGADGDVVLSGTDEVPAEFRALVEEYYRSLARQKGRQ